MERSTSTRIVFLGVVVVVVGVFAWVGGGTDRIGVHPINLFTLVPAYVVVGVGAVIVAMGVVPGFASRKRA